MRKQTSASRIIGTPKLLSDLADSLNVFGGNISALPGTGPTLDDLVDEMALMPTIDDDLALDEVATKREFIDATKLASATATLNRIPAPDAARHMLISGKFALWDFVGAVLQLASPAIIEDLHLATLGFSVANITQAADFLDAGKVQNFSLLCSHYFRGTSTEIYDLAVSTLNARRPRARFLSCRTHAKLLAMQLSDGRTVTIESSANARSCHNLEQCTAYGDPAVYQFHTTWINQLFTQGEEHVTA